MTSSSPVAGLQPHIHAILSAPSVDLASISAKRVRKQLVESGAASADFVRVHKAAVDALIADVFQLVSAERNFVAAADDDEDGDDVDGADAGEGDGAGEGAGNGYGGGESEEDRRRTPQQQPPPPSSPAKKAAAKPGTAGTRKRKRKADAHTDDDEAYAKRLQAELNPPARASRSGGAGAGTKRRKPAKSAETVDDASDADPDAEPKKKRRGGGGFQKPYQLSEPLVAVLNHTVLPRGQVVKMLWGYIKDNNLQNPSDRREILCDDKLRAVFKLDKVTMFSMNKELSKHLIDPATA